MIVQEVFECLFICDHREQMQARVFVRQKHRLLQKIATHIPGFIAACEKKKSRIYKMKNYETQMRKNIHFKIFWLTWQMQYYSVFLY